MKVCVYWAVGKGAGRGGGGVAADRIFLFFRNKRKYTHVCKYDVNIINVLTAVIVFC